MKNLENMYFTWRPTYINKPSSQVGSSWYPDIIQSPVGHILNLGFSSEKRTLTSYLTTFLPQHPLLATDYSKTFEPD